MSQLISLFLSFFIPIRSKAETLPGEPSPCLLPVQTSSRGFWPGVSKIKEVHHNSAVKASKSLVNDRASFAWLGAFV